MGKLKPINPTKAQIVANPQAAAHDYDNLTHKPQINGHELSGDQSGSDLGLQNQLTAGDNVTIDENGVISAEGGGSQIVSGVVNANGTITFTDSDGNTFTTTGLSVIGADGVGIADVHIDGGGDLIIETTDGHMENVGHVVGADGADGTNGKDGTNGADGFSPVATVTQTASGATVSITDKNGTTTANISNGADGQDYVLTSQDKTDIANIVLGELPTTQGVLYGD